MVAGAVVAVAALAWLLRHQRSAWKQVRKAALFADEEQGHGEPPAIATP